jgi:hypothetical protein
MRLKKIFTDLYGQPAGGYMTVLSTGAAITAISSFIISRTSFTLINISTGFSSIDYKKEVQLMSEQTLSKILTFGAYIMAPLAFEMGMQAAKHYFSSPRPPADQSPMLISLNKGLEAVRNVSFLRNIISGAAGIVAHYLFASMLAMSWLTDDEQSALFAFPARDVQPLPLASLAAKGTVAFAASLPIAALASHAAHSVISYVGRCVERETIGRGHAP